MASYRVVCYCDNKVPSCVLQSAELCYRMWCVLENVIFGGVDVSGNGIACQVEVARRHRFVLCPFCLHVASLEH